MRRVTLDEALQTWGETGLRPVQGTMFDGRDGACLVGALLAQHCGVGELRELRGNFQELWRRVKLFRELGFPEQYLVGLIEGFDGVLPFASSLHEFHRLGFEDGRAIADAVFSY